jgi:hypothetical protein
MESKDLNVIRAAAQVAASMQSGGPLAEQASQAAQAAFEEALAEGQSTESAMQEAQAAANAVVAGATVQESQGQEEYQESGGGQDTSENGE